MKLAICDGWESGWWGRDWRNLRKTACWIEVINITAQSTILNRRLGIDDA
jgi:hypothetical protein